MKVLLETWSGTAQKGILLLSLGLTYVSTCPRVKAQPQV